MKDIKLKEFGIYTIGNSILIMIEFENNKIHYFIFPLHFFRFSTLTNKCINEALDILSVEYSEIFGTFIYSQFDYKLDIENFAYIGEVKNKETRDRLINELNEIKHKF